MMICPPWWQAESRIVPPRDFPGRDARGRAFDSVIGAVAHQVGQRIPHQFENLAVELGFGAMHLELDLLAELGAEVAHNARQFLPGIADRLHTGLHHAFLKLGGDVREPLQRHLEVRIFVAADDLKQLVAGQHQLGNGGHQAIERVDADADRMACEPLAGFGRRFFAGVVAALSLSVAEAASCGVSEAVLAAFSLALFSDGRRRGRLLLRHLRKPSDQVGVVAGRLLLLGLELVEDRS